MSMLNMSVKAKLYVTLAISAIILVSVGVVGLSGTKSSNHDLDAIFSNRFMPTGWVGALDRIVAASLSFGIFYLAAVIFLHRGWAPLHLVGSFLPDLFPQGFPGASAADRATPDAGPRRPSIVGGQVSTQRAN